MHHVYFLRSESSIQKTYIGETNNLRRRLKEHNNGENGYTSKFMPWEIEAYVITTDKETALIVEKHFKNGSGKEKFKNFAKKNPHVTREDIISLYFESLKPNRSAFGNTANRTRVKVIQNDGVPLFKRVSSE